GLLEQLSALGSQPQHRARARPGRRAARGRADHPARCGASVTRAPARGAKLSLFEPGLAAVVEADAAHEALGCNVPREGGGGALTRSTYRALRIRRALQAFGVL